MDSEEEKTTEFFSLVGGGCLWALAILAVVALAGFVFLSALMKNAHFGM